MEKKKALVVDDMLDLRSLTKMMLMMRGFAVDEATQLVRLGLLAGVP